MPYSESQAGDDAALRQLLLAMPAEHALDALLGMITGHLAAFPSVALARLWLIRDGDICPSCPLARECPERSRCLHLVASAGRPREHGADWSRLDGSFRRFPLGERKIGHIAKTNTG